MALRQNHIRWLLIFAAWTAAGLLSAGTEYFTAIAINRPYPYSTAAWWNLAAFYLFAVSFPAVTYVARRFPFDRQRWLHRAITYVGWIFLLSVLHLIGFLLIYWMIGGARLPRNAPLADALAYFRLLFAGNIRTSLIIYALLLFGVMAANYYQRFLAGEQRAAQLQAQLAQAQLQALKMQLHPHFLFNTLNAVSELVHKEPDTAERMVIQLSDMLRVSLDSIGVQEIPLSRSSSFCGGISTSRRRASGIGCASGWMSTRDSRRVCAEYDPAAAGRECDPARASRPCRAAGASTSGRGEMARRSICRSATTAAGSRRMASTRRAGTVSVWRTRARG
jgi:hypothetical protein